VAALDEADAVLGELPERVDHRVNGVHGGGAGRERRSRVGRPSVAWRRRRGGGFARALPSRRGGVPHLWLDVSEFGSASHFATTAHLEL
jgi:hypothetical protein